MSKKVLSVFLVLLAMVLMFTSSIPVIAASTGDTGVSSAARATTIKITAQPKSVVVAKGKTATVSFEATGEGLTYTWYYRDATESSFKKTTTFSGNTYTATMTAARSGREIYCVVKDKAGNSVKTNVVTISMENSVQITSQPQSVIAPKGSTATLQVKAKGEGLTYKWYYKDTGMSAFKRTDTFKGNTYTAEMASKRDGRQIYCVITDKNGCSVKTNTVTLTMGNPVKITTQPKSVVVADGKTATVSFKATGEGLTYTWYYRDATASSFKKTTTFTGDTYTATMKGARSGRELYCLVTDKAGNSVRTNVVTISMENAVQITSQPESVVAPNGSTATLQVKAKGEGLTYKWYYKDTGMSAFKSTDTFKGNTYTAEMASKRDGRQIYCVITDKNGCSVKTQIVTLTMGNPAKITTQPKSAVVANGKTATVSFKATGDGLIYTWYYKDAGASSFKKTDTFKGNTYTAEMASKRDGRQIYCVITDKYGNTVQTKTVTISMEKPLSIVTQPSSVITAAGTEAKVTVEAAGNGLTYKWYYKDAGASSFKRTDTFKGNTYSVEMTSKRDGRQIYCVITDANGNSVKTKTVTLYKGTPLAITKQPSSVTAAQNSNAVIRFEVVGEGLTYTWYYKEAGASSFKKTDSFKSNTYSVEMTSKRNGRQVYCVITDKFGNSVTTKTVAMYMGVPTTITMQPESVVVNEGETAVVTVGAVGEGITYKWYYKNPGSTKFVATDTFSGPVYIVNMTESRSGRQIYCVITDKNGGTVQTDIVTLSVAPAYQITVDLGNGNSYVVDVAKDGAYKLTKPTRAGYSFEGWKTAAGKTFKSSGTISKDTTVYATWSIVNTDTLEKLIAHTNGGASEIRITANIVINQPIYISYETTIYADTNVTLTRDPNYKGDIFVVGKDANGVTSLLHHRPAALTLGGGKGTLTIDGNKTKTKVDVVGSLIFAGDSSTVILKDGVRLCNNNKVANDRMLGYGDSMSETSMTRAGGAAIIINNSTVYMYGGTIENNSVKLEHTVITNAEGTEEKYETAGCGGAIYNNGEFRMYGGVIQGNEALRGGAIYNIYPTYLEAGTIQNNKSYTYGGAVSTSSGSYANLYLGSEGTGSALLIKGNYSKSAGGALYSNTSAPIIILGNTVFEGNSTDYSGGAIYTGGSLTVRNTTFRGNTSPYSGGAIFFHNTKDSTWEPRRAEITGCTFEENKGSLGGAITFSRSNKDDPKATGVVATVTNCRFYKNEAIKNENNPGNGGAIYVTQLANVTISGCEFTENTAANTGGAVGIHGEATAKLTDLVFAKNTAVNGAGLYLSVNTTNTLNNLTFVENRAVRSASDTEGNGGAIYAVQAKVTAQNLDIRNNTAAQHAGAIYLNAVTLTLGADNTIEGNTAGDHGGAFYLTYTNHEDGTRTGSNLVINNAVIKDNTAKTGGVISIRTDCEATFNGATLQNNEATATYVEGQQNMGGGVAYVGYGKLTMNNTVMENNVSAYYGGAVFSRASQVTIDGGRISGSTGSTGAALYFCDGGTAELKNFTLENTTALYNGAIYTNGPLTMTNVTATGNKAANGGVLFLNGTQVTIKNSTFTGNSATNGGAVYAKGANTVNVEGCVMSDNTANYGGAIYFLENGKLNLIGNTFQKNTAERDGGAIYNKATVITATDTADAKNVFAENSAANHGGAIYVVYIKDEATGDVTGGVLNMTGGIFTENTAMGGGAVSARTGCEVNFNGTVFTENTVTGNDGKADGQGEGGGAVYVGYGKLTVANATFTGNTAEKHGGAVQLVDTETVITGTTFTNNSGGQGGAVNVTAGGELDLTNSTFTGNSVTGNGGAVSLSSGTTGALKNLVFTNNHADGNGGALYDTDADMTIEKLDMQGNSAGGNGGALYLQGREVNLDSSSVFKNNSAGGHGGAIYLTYKTIKGENGASDTRIGAILNATGVTFEGNTAMAGGAISARSACVVNLDGTILKDNSVAGFQNNGDEDPSDDNDGDSEGGGAIYVGYGQLTMKNVTATGNSAADFGGVVDAVSSPVTITGGTFSNNTTNTGGVLHAMGNCTVTVNGATFTGNKSLYENTTSNSDIGGGVFHTVGGTLHITGCTIDGNSSKYYGGVILANKTAITIDGETVLSNNTGATGAVLHMRSATVVLDGITLTDNTSSMNGVIYYAGGNLTLDGITASGNTAYQGGVLFVNNATVTVKDSTFTGNSATNGGVIYAKGGATLNVENCQMAENGATYGGAIYTIEGSTLNLSGTTFLKNSATKDGGAIYNKGGVVTAEDAETAKNVFTENSAGSHGGAIYVVYTKNEETNEITAGGVLNMTGGTFTGNTAMGGGAVSARTSCEANFDGTTFIGNKVTGNDGKVDGYGEGGGAVFTNNGKVTMTNVTATGNESETYGGAVQATATELTVTGSTFTGNKAASGGAIYTMGGTNASITKSTFAENTATDNAGAVAVMSSVTGELKELVFTGNHADGNGGALFLYNTEVTTEALDMQNNTATGNGGAAYVNAVDLVLTASDVFKNNTAGGHGGAIYLVYNEDKVGATLTGTDVVFENNTAKAGGAISARSYCVVEITGGTFKGNSATAPQADGLGGGAIYTNTNTVTLTGVTLEGNTAAYYGGALYATDADVTINGKSVIKGNGAVTGVALYMKSSGTATLNDVTVTENMLTMGNANGVIYVSGSVALDVEKLTATGNKAVNGGVFYISGSVSGTVQDSTLTGNTATGNGGVIDFRSSGTLDVTGCTITGNTAKNGGALYCENGVVNVSGCQMAENTASTSGGAISVAKAGKVNVGNETTVTKNSAPTGGAVYLDRGGRIEITGITLEENTATGNGGAIAATDNPKEGETPASAVLTLNNVTLKNNTAKQGGAIYMAKASAATVTGGSFTGNRATHGGAIFLDYSSLDLADVAFTENTATNNGGAIYNVGGTVTGAADFDKNTAGGHAGAIYLTYIKGIDGAENIPGVATLTGGSFINNTAMAGGAVSVRTGCIATLDAVTFTGNTVSGYVDNKDDKPEDDNDGDNEGGGAIYVGYGTVILNNCTATGNTSTDSYGGFLDSVQGVVNITGGTYSENVAPTGGAIYSIYASKITITGATISENESTFVNPYKVDNTDTYDSLKGGGAIAMNKGTLTISNTTLDGNKSVYYGGTILAAGATVTLNENTVVSGSVGKTGAAIYLRDSGKTRIENSSILNNKDAGSGVIYISWGTLDLVNVTASGNTANTGGVVNASGSGATVNVTGGNYTGNSATYGGVIYINKEAKVNLSGATFTENTSYLGGAIYNTGSTLTAENSTFTKNSATKESNGGNGNGGAVTIAGGTFTGTGTNVFTENTAENHGGAIYVSYTGSTDETRVGGVVIFTGGTFDKNIALAGGAVSLRTDCEGTFTGTTFTANEATGEDTMGGGAIYAGYGSLTLSGCTMDGNKTAYYGGAVTGHGSDIEIKDGTVIKNSIGKTGAALQFRNGGTAKLDTVTISNTDADSNGVVYITGEGTLELKNVTGTDNQAYQGGILYASGNARITVIGGTYTGNSATNGGVFFQSCKSLTIIGGTYSGNSAKNGGVLYTSSTAIVTGSEMKENNVTGAGGAIYATGTGAKVTVNGGSQLNSNTAPTGGAVYLDLGATVTIDGSTLDGNSATSYEGGAIAVADSTKENPKAATKLVMTNTTLSNNTAKTRGGALTTDVTSPNLIIHVTGCTFTKNSAPTSGGAVCIMNGNCNSATDPTEVTIIFTNCTFTENTAGLGGALDIRSGSCMKIDGITATGNTGTDGAAVIYVTSNYSRLYLTGTVSAENNVATSGKFATLANNKYSNPPKVYTTHSNTATWYADVAGNRNNVAFDLTTLP